jgi:hypothetical protein
LPGSTQPQAKLNASLVQVSLPSADGQAPVQRHYHYEDPRHPTLLTGISVQGQGSDGKPMDERIASYAYGDTGRAILSVRGPPDSQQEKVTLDLSQPWKNTSPTALGKQPPTTTTPSAGNGDCLKCAARAAPAAAPATCATGTTRKGA